MNLTIKIIICLLCVLTSCSGHDEIKIHHFENKSQRLTEEMTSTFENIDEIKDMPSFLKMSKELYSMKLFRFFILQSFLFHFIIEEKEIEHTFNKYGFLTYNTIKPYTVNLSTFFLYAVTTNQQIELRPELPWIFPDDVLSIDEKLTTLMSLIQNPFETLWLFNKDIKYLQHAENLLDDAYMHLSKVNIGEIYFQKGYYYLKRGLIEHHSGHLEGAVDNWKVAIEHFDKSPFYRELIWQIYVLIGLEYYQNRNFIAARENFSNAINQIEKIGISSRLEDFKANYFNYRLIVYELLINSMIKDGLYPEGLKYVEMVKARVLLDKSNSQKLGNAIVKTNDNIMQIINKISSLEKKSIFLGEKKDIVSNTTEDKKNSFFATMKEFEKQSDKLQLRHLLYYKCDAFLSEYTALLYLNNDVNIKSISPTVIDKKSLRTFIGNDGVILDYYVTADSIFIWIIGQDGLIDFKKNEIKSETLAKDISELRRHVKDINLFKTPAHRLYSYLIEPVEKYITGKRLIIVPHQVLHYLPFESLMKKNEFLIVDHEVSYLPNLKIIDLLNSNRYERKSSFLGIGFNGIHLEKAETEIEAIDSLFNKNHHSKIVINNLANKNIINEMGNYDIIHLSAHANVFESCPLLSNITLFNGNLYAYEMNFMPLKASLVVLSACNTNMGDVTSGDEITTLNRSFISSGAQSVLSSLWLVDDNSALDFFVLSKIPSIFSAFKDNGINSLCSIFAIYILPESI
ncbi:conserved hypothetical protein, secreted [Candidatus Magnetobacterium bavaricum]|uniref:CHAT domain-containing protein n=1 Tax=Candidatus Magnetobacterium bavaricum TaxID=29290 RepID=A0A0F3GJ89_9BACT|nr:conserved hypothetical protein, secreted [Candidatus Magnetobacterium bavaricum]